MKKACIFFLLPVVLILLMITSAIAGKITDINYETLTLRLYYEQKWDSLLTIGEEAIDNGYDYYYMRVRVGEAAFYKQRYVRAAGHFEKALQFNNQDEYATRLLYKSYHYSGRADEARWLMRKLPVAMAADIGRADRKPELYMEAGPAFTDHVKQFEKNRQAGPGTYSEVFLNRNSQYLLAGADFPVGYKMGLNFAAGALNFNKNRQVAIAFIDSLAGDYSVVQFEAYMSPSFNITSRIKVSPAFRFVNVSLSNPLKSEDVIVQQIIGPSGTFNYNDYAFGGEVSYSAPRWTFSAGAWSLMVDRQKFTQASGTVFLKPFGNLNLYSSTSVNLRSTSYAKDYIIYQMIGGRIYHELWGEAFMSWGNLSGTAEHNLQVIYNAIDEVKSRSGARLILSISDYLSLSLRYQLFSKRGTEFFMVDPPGQIFSYNYMNQSITGGIKWNLH